MLPPFATWEDVAARTPGAWNDDDTTRTEAALEDISALIRAEGLPWYEASEDDPPVYTLPADVPSVLKVIAITAARREMSNPEGVIATTTDGYSERLANASTGVYLTPNEKRMIRRAAGRSGLWTLKTTRGLIETERCPTILHGSTDVFLDVVGSEAIPFLPEDAGSGLTP